LLSGSPIRQEYLETALSWISNGKIEDYMARHQHDENADELWNYFQNVIAWVRKIFPNYRREMKNVSWGELYNKFKDKKLDVTKLEEEINDLMQDEDVTKKSGIYFYVLTRDERFLNIRTFTEKMKSARHTNAKKAFVQGVKNILKLRKWRQIISNPGVRVEKQLPKIARCFVKIAIAENQAHSS